MKTILPSFCDERALIPSLGSSEVFAQIDAPAVEHTPPHSSVSHFTGLAMFFFSFLFQPNTLSSNNKVVPPNRASSDPLFDVSRSRIDLVGGDAAKTR